MGQMGGLLKISEVVKALQEEQTVELAYPTGYMAKGFCNKLLCKIALRSFSPQFVLGLALCIKKKI